MIEKKLNINIIKGNYKIIITNWLTIRKIYAASRARDTGWSCIRNSRRCIIVIVRSLNNSRTPRSCQCVTRRFFDCCLPNFQLCVKNASTLKQKKTEYSLYSFNFYAEEYSTRKISLEEISKRWICSHNYYSSNNFQFKMLFTMFRFNHENRFLWYSKKEKEKRKKKKSRYL